ncbi:hypothetical protein [Phascolarctobacterium faecium]|uniref:hypothetical protein n=1 Tax=Phascolarctobacterium faecium TaxID=33025 RepID=UPI002673EA67|nr:hypothetical protein [Phascolarctobacterium faecium]
MLNRTLFKIKAKYKPTNRIRTIKVWARSENEINDKLVTMDYEPADTIEILPQPPSDKQIDLAKSLGYVISPEMTAMDLQAIISQKLDRDSAPPKAGLMEFADEKDIVFSNYTGKKAMYNLVFAKLSEIDKLAFFIFCVYRHLSNDRESNLNKSPYKNFFYEFAADALSDRKMVSSLINNYSGEDMRFFGTIRTGNSEYYGGSTKTTIFKSAKQYLIDSGLIPDDINNNVSLPIFHNPSVTNACSETTEVVGESKIDTQMQKKSFTYTGKSKTFIWATLILFWPYGIYLMFKSPEFSILTRCTVILLIFIIYKLFIA